MEESTIIELKLCGAGYSWGYAQGGLSQLQHYMVARKAKTGYLLIFDARTRDYGKTFSIEDTIDSKNISVKIIDIRPVIKPNL